MEWQGMSTTYQQTKEGSPKAHAYYYVYRVRKGYWVAGRFWLGEEVSYRIPFDTAKQARDYCEMKDEEYWRNRIVAIEA